MASHKAFTAGLLSTLAIQIVQADRHLEFFTETSDASVDLANFAPQPINYMFGYDYNSYDPTTDEAFYEHIGFEASFNIDLAVGYEAFFQWIVRDKENLLVINPNFWVEVATKNWIGFKLYFIEWWFRFDIVGYKFTPVDY